MDCWNSSSMHLCSYAVGKTGLSYTRGCLCLQQHLCALKCNADLKKLSDATLILFHVLHVKALMEIARISAYHGSCQCNIQTKVPHQMSQINCPNTAVAHSNISSTVEAAALQAYCTGNVFTTQLQTPLRFANMSHVR